MASRPHRRLSLSVVQTQFVLHRALQRVDAALEGIFQLTRNMGAKEDNLCCFVLICTII